MNAFSQLGYMQHSIDKIAEHFKALDDYGLEDAKCALVAKQIRVLANCTAIAMGSFRRQLEKAAEEH